MKTIVYIVNQLRKSGPIHVLKSIVSNLDRNLFCPVVIKFMHDDKKRSITHEFLQMGVDVYEMGLSFWDLELRTSYVASKLKVLLEDIHPDILHTHGYHPVLVTSRLKDICPKIETLHCISSEYYISSKGILVGHWMDWRYLKCLSHMDSCVAISNTVLRFYQKKLLPFDISMIYNGIKTHNFLESPNRTDLRKKNGMNNSALIFVVVGTLSKGKDPETVIKAFSIASDIVGEDKIELFFLGQGPLLNKCLELVGNRKNIKLVGYVFNVMEYLLAADCSICASHSEGFGLNFIESILAGVPVISSRIGSFCEFTNLYKQLKTLQFDPANSKELACKIVQFVNNPHIIDMENIVKDASIRFSEEKMGHSYMKLYYELSKNA